MKINRIVLKNIGPHKATEIFLDDKPPVCAITGRNGAGKTFLLEAAPACLYGDFPTRPGSLYDRITNGWKGEASIRVDFEMNGTAYQAVRKLKQSGKTTSSEATLSRMGSIVDVVAGPKVTDFEQAIRNLLGHEDTFLASVFSSQKNTGDLCDAKPSERKAVLGRLIGLEKYDVLSDAAKNKSRSLTAEIESQELALSVLKERSSGVVEQKTSLNEMEAELVEAQQKLEIQKERVREVEKKINAGAVAKERWLNLDKQLASLSQEVEALEAALKCGREAWTSLKNQIAAAPDPIQAQQAYDEALEVKDSLQKKAQEEDRLASEKRLAESEIRAIQAELKQLESRAGLIDKTPAQEICKTCPLVASAWEAKNAMTYVQDRLDKAQAKLDGMDAIPPSTTKSALSDVTLALPGLKAAVDSSRAVGELKGRLGELEAQGKAQKAELEKKRTDYQKLEIEVKVAMDQCSPANLDNDLAMESQSQRTIERGIESLLGEISSAKTIIKQKETDAEKATGIEAHITGVRQKISDLKEIERAFGRSGIQPLIIEQARPELEQVANEMLGQATEGRMQVRFATTKELKSGETAESLDIIITRDGQEQEIGEFSGGEQKLIRTAIRLTLSVWQARRGGSRLRTLFIDEVFDSLDAENSERILKLLQSLQGQFDRILLISHDDDLLEILPGRIAL